MKAVVRNVAYKGCISFNDDIYPGLHQAIVPADLWETVAQQLRDFGEVITHLEPEEKKELVRLLIREVRVNHADHKKAPEEATEADSSLQLRNNRFVLNISFFATGLFSEIKRTGVKHFDFQQKWLPE